MNGMDRQNSAALLIFIVAGAAAFAQTPDPPAADPPTASADHSADENAVYPSENTVQILALIDRLSSASYDQREAADDELREIGMSAVDHLARTYQQTDDFEARIRIQRITEHIFFWDRVFGRNGFLGISHRVHMPSGNDTRVEPGKAAFEVMQVLPDTAAERAGVRVGDLILAVDRTRLPEGSGPADFADLIRYKRPGTVLSLEFYRGGEHREMRIAIGHRPLHHYGNSAPADLNSQLDAAVKEFPTWWSSRFGSLPSRFFSQQPAPGRPLFLNIPSDYDDK